MKIQIQKELPRPAKDGEDVSIDIEMFGQERTKLHRPHGTFACISIAYSDTEIYQVYDLADLRKSLTRLKKGNWVGQNLLYDIRQMRRFTEIKQRQVWDTMLMEQAMFGGYYNSFALTDLVRRWLGFEADKDIRSNFKEATKMTVPMQQYAASDAVLTLRVKKVQEQHQIDIDEEVMKHYWEGDEPMIWAVLDMQPVAIDVDGWIRFAKDNLAQGMAIQEELGFNVKSPDQTKAAIEEICHVEVPDTNKKDTLDPLLLRWRDEGRDEKHIYFMERLLEARMYRDAYSRYGEKFIEKHGVQEGKYTVLYGDWKVTGTETGRMSCSNPPLQTIPTRNMPKFRELFISRHDGGSMVVADFSHQEPRIMAWYSDDENLKEALESGRDLHQETADDFGLDRRGGKDINLGLGYGMSPEGLASRVGISLDEAIDGIEKRNARYPMANQWMKKVRRSAFRIGYSTTSIGRRVWINPHGSQWERNAVNNPIQGTAAEQIKLLTVQNHSACKELDLEFGISLIVHDEVVVDSPKGLVVKHKKNIKDAGSYAAFHTVPGMPMPIDTVTGKSWGAKKQ